MLQGSPDVGIVGDRGCQGHAASILGDYAILDQCGGVDEQTGRNALVEPVALEPSSHRADLDQLLGNIWRYSRFSLQDGSLKRRIRIVEIECGKALLGGRLEVF